jgi:hypothetical protein
MSEQSTSRKPKIPKHKVAIVQRAVAAQRVEEIINTPVGQFIPNSQDSGGPILQKVGIPSTSVGPGRPSKFQQKELQLPQGLNVLRKGRYTWSDELGEQFIEAYYQCGGSMTRACRRANVKYAAALEWRETRTEFSQALREIDQIIRDEVHSQFMERVLTTWEPNPSWKFKYFNKYFPEYSENKRGVKVTFNLKDTLIKPDYVDGEVIKPKQLEAENVTRSEQPMETPPNTS